MKLNKIGQSILGLGIAANVLACNPISQVRLDISRKLNQVTASKEKIEKEEFVGEFMPKSIAMLASQTFDTKGKLESYGHGTANHLLRFRTKNSAGEVIIKELFSTASHVIETAYAREKGYVNDGTTEKLSLLPSVNVGVYEKEINLSVQGPTTNKYDYILSDEYDRLIKEKYIELAKQEQALQNINKVFKSFSTDFYALQLLHSDLLFLGGSSKAYKLATDVNGLATDLPLILKELQQLATRIRISDPTLKNATKIAALLPSVQNLATTIDTEVLAYKISKLKTKNIGHDMTREDFAYIVYTYKEGDFTKDFTTQPLATIEDDKYLFRRHQGSTVHPMLSGLNTFVGLDIKAPREIFTLGHPANQSDVENEATVTYPDGTKNNFSTELWIDFHKVNQVDTKNHTIVSSQQGNTHGSSGGIAAMYLRPTGDILVDKTSRPLLTANGNQIMVGGKHISKEHHYYLVDAVVNRPIFFQEGKLLSTDGVDKSKHYEAVLSRIDGQIFLEESGKCIEISEVNKEKPFVSVYQTQTAGVMSRLDMTQRDNKNYPVLLKISTNTARIEEFKKKIEKSFGKIPPLQVGYKHYTLEVK